MWNKFYTDIHTYTETSIILIETDIFFDKPDTFSRFDGFGQSNSFNIIFFTLPL